MPRSYKQSIYNPINKDKYKGTLPIVCRSSWERRLCVFLDKHPSIQYWGSESVVIPYLSPVDHRMHRYFVDFIVLFVTRSGETKKALIEVKPAAQTKMPESKKRNTKSYLDAVCTYEVNQAKWKAAREWCSQRGMEFMIFTEKELGLVK